MVIPNRRSALLLGNRARLSILLGAAREPRWARGYGNSCTTTPGDAVHILKAKFPILREKEKELMCSWFEHEREERKDTNRKDDDDEDDDDGDAGDPADRQPRNGGLGL